MFMKGLKRRDANKTVRRAKPLTMAMLKKAMTSLSKKSGLMAWRTIWRMCIGFTCFLRWDDIRRLKVNINHLIMINEQ